MDPDVKLVGAKESLAVSCLPLSHTTYTGHPGEEEMGTDDDLRY